MSNPIEAAVDPGKGGRDAHVELNGSHGLAGT
jgi:hypothetical protein